MSKKLYNFLELFRTMVDFKTLLITKNNILHAQF